MTKKWKLIKKYPFDNCPEIGAIVQVGGDGNIRFHGLKVNPTNYPEYWQPIVEKTYKITGFYLLLSSNNKPNQDYIWREKCPGFWAKYVNGQFVTTPYTTSEIMENTMYEIYSVERLSDGQKFCVGDEVRMGNMGIHKITGFETTTSGDIRINYVGPFGLKMGHLIGNVTVPTRGYPVFTKDGYSYKPFTFIPQRWDVDKDNKDVKYFKTEEEAKDFIVKHKPCLSIQEVFDEYERTGGVYFSGFVWAKLHKALTNIVKSKIKK